MRWKIERFSYDVFGRVLSKTDAEGNITKYEYDLEDNLEGKIGKDPIKVITNSGYEYEYTYDNVGRNTEI
ncbi:MAG: RHS repeat protein, partial [Romboutsia sp.]|nr:RHS repeat protein [Romboutsia sp.]